MQTTKPILLSAAVSMGLLGASPALATESITGPIKESDVKALCDRTGGTFTRAPDGSGYGCSNECNGGTCSVSCSPAACSIRTPEPYQRFVSGIPDPKADALLQLAVDSRGHDRGDKGLPSWIGLLGLLGLAGLFVRNRDRVSRP